MAAMKPDSLTTITFWMASLSHHIEGMLASSLPTKLLVDELAKIPEDDVSFARSEWQQTFDGWLSRLENWREDDQAMMLGLDALEDIIDTFWACVASVPEDQLTMDMIYPFTTYSAADAYVGSVLTTVEGVRQSMEHVPPPLG